MSEKKKKKKGKKTPENVREQLSPQRQPLKPKYPIRRTLMCTKPKTKAKEEQQRQKRSCSNVKTNTMWWKSATRPKRKRKENECAPKEVIKEKSLIRYDDTMCRLSSHKAKSNTMLTAIVAVLQSQNQAAAQISRPLFAIRCERQMPTPKVKPKLQLSTPHKIELFGATQSSNHSRQCCAFVFSQKSQVVDAPFSGNTTQSRAGGVGGNLQAEWVPCIFFKTLSSICK